MNKITVLPNKRVLSYEQGETLLEVLSRNNILIESACGGKGTCGKCKIKCYGEHLPELSKAEREHLGIEEIEDGYRLACLLKPDSDLQIVLEAEKTNDIILTDGYLPHFDRMPAVKKIVCQLKKPDMADNHSYESILLQLTGGDSVTYEALAEIPSAPGLYTCVLYRRNIIKIEKGDTSKTLYGLAVDIGTTTIVVSLVDMVTGEELAADSAINPQKKYGLDVLTRITYVNENTEDGLKNLQSTLVNGINELIDSLVKRVDINKKDIFEIVVAANNMMLHSLLGINPASIGRSPYAPIFKESKYIKAASIGISLLDSAVLYCLPSVSSYIGADIVAGAFVSEIYKKKGNVLFIDIGTNGEIILSADGSLISCSCAAGPALEGMNISSGMRAASGAIEDIQFEGDRVVLNVIDDIEPKGICGSGIISAIGELVKNGFLKRNGALYKESELVEEDSYKRKFLWSQDKKRGIILYENNLLKIMITQKDIRQVQLAKGAILSGFYALLKYKNISMEDLDHVIIAGQFGSHLSAESLVLCGLLPKEMKHKISYMGNTSKTGAYTALLSLHARNKMESLAKDIKYIELSAIEDYEKLFVKCLAFPVENTELI